MTQRPSDWPLWWRIGGRVSANMVSLTEREQSSMVSTWDEGLLLTARANGTFTLKARKWGEGGTEYVYCSRPFRTGEQFLLELDIAGGALYWDALRRDEIEALIPAIEELNRELAQQVGKSIPLLEKLRSASAE